MATRDTSSGTTPGEGFETIVFEVDALGVATVTLDRPEQLNAFTHQMASEFETVWERVRTDDDVRVVVLRAAGDRAFSTGIDVQDTRGWPSMDNPFAARDPGFYLGPKQNHVYKPVVAAVHGLVAGGAFYWLNETDIIICSDDAEFFDPHVTYGMVSALEAVGLVRRIPLGEALRLVLLGLDERMSAERAHQIGLVSEVVERSALWERAREIAARIAYKPPAAVQGSLKAMWESLDRGRRAALDGALVYTQVGNPLGMTQIDRSKAKPTDHWTR